MSLHKFAEQVAANGRGDDSLLVHMTPDEVRNLQKFAEANGTTLTINPTTGLPEAGLLSDLFKAVAPIALGAFLGPAGLAFGGPGLSAAMAGVATGGITALATGSLSRGLMAGLGAYGGAGMGESLMHAGTGALSQAAGAGLEQGAAEQAIGAKLASATPMETLTAGFNSATANPAAMGDFAKRNLGNLAYTAAPLMAMQPTTKMPEVKSTGNIRQFDYNINPDTGRPDPLYGMRAMAPVKASEFGDKTFQGQRELFRQQNPNPYELGVGSLNQPPQQQPRMNTGGIVALAGGGDVKHFAIGDLVKADIDKAYAAGDYAKVNELAQANKITASDVADTYKGFDTSGLAGLGINLYAPPAQQAAPVVQAPTYTSYTPEQIGSYLTTNPTVDIGAATKQFNADPNAVNQYIASLDNPFRGSTETTGGSGTLGIYNQMKAQGIDPNELYAANLAVDPKYAGWSQADIQRGYNLDKGAYALSDQLKGNVSDKDWVKFMDDNKYSIDDAAQAFGLSQKEVRDRYNAVKAAETKIINKKVDDTGLLPTVVTPPPDPFTSVVPGGTQLPGATVYDNGAYGNYGSGPATGVDYKGNTVSIATPGDIITNPDQTRTVVPNVPGRPYGGFSGMEAVKSAYTAGGGSLGYTAKAPKTIDEFNQLYNKQTGDSLAAYDYLMGKGAGKYPVKSSVPKIAVPYDEYVLGKKTAKPVAKTTSTTGTTKVLNSDGTVNETETDKANFDYAAYLRANPDVQAELDAGKANFGTKDDLASAAYNHYVTYGKAQNRPLRAAEGGMMGYSVGGGLGSLGAYSDGGRLLKGPGDGVSDSIPATIGNKQQPARLADGEFVVPARIVSELGNGSTDAGAKKLYAMMDRVQKARGKTTGKNKVAANSRADQHLPA